MVQKYQSGKYAPVLWILLGLFLLRVLAQGFVMSGKAPYLPPPEAWQSGLLPYPALLASQLLILAVFTKAAVDLTRGAGFFAVPRPGFGKFLLWFGVLYFALMLLRFLMWLPAGGYWKGGIIPIVFHWVLAAFILTAGRYHFTGKRLQEDV